AAVPRHNAVLEERTDLASGGCLRVSAACASEEVRVAGVATRAFPLRQPGERLAVEELLGLGQRQGTGQRFAGASGWRLHGTLCLRLRLPCNGPPGHGEQRDRHDGATSQKGPPKSDRARGCQLSPHFHDSSSPSSATVSTTFVRDDLGQLSEREFSLSMAKSALVLVKRGRWLGPGERTCP